jgi:predicted aldo/keto reductase-like oxidoreductase
MSKTGMGRRHFIKTCVAATAAVGAWPAGRLLASGATGPEAGAGGNGAAAFDAKGLPTRVLGKSGIAVPIIGFGGGSRFCRITEPEKSAEVLSYALDNGLYYWDTAHNYTTDQVISEERLGLVAKDRRKEIFLATKIEDRTADGAMRQLELSLKRLRTDYLDILQVHSVESLEDVDKIGAKGGVLEALHKLRAQRVARLIGFSGHASAEAMTAAAERYDFDTMLIALNHQQGVSGDMEKGAIPAAAKKKMGVMVIKVIRPKETVPGVNPEELIRYALTLEHVKSAVIGMDSLDVLKKDIELLKNFRKMNPAEMEAMRRRLGPFYAGLNLPWMNPAYTDGRRA